MGLFTNMDTPTSTLVNQYCATVQAPAAWSGSYADLTDQIAMETQNCAEYVKEKKGLAGRKLALGLCNTCISARYADLKAGMMAESEASTAAFLSQKTVPIPLLLGGFFLAGVILYLLFSK